MIATALLSLMLSEAGVVSVFCKDATCMCANVTCSCGQVCDGNVPACRSSMFSWCTDDSECDAGCGAFTCVNNHCARPDGGTVPDGPSGAAGGSGGGSMSPGGCSCSAAPMLLPLVALAVWRARRRSS
ncbi:MAG: hypothetical protein JNK82_43530 [Myxococcaceae bacterium]|nr:hypothetical protein [Myxococcaceae bacterium]